MEIKIHACGGGHVTWIDNTIRIAFVYRKEPINQLYYTNTVYFLKRI